MELSSFVKVVEEFVAKKGISKATLARSVGVSPATLTQVLKGTYGGNWDNVATKVLNYIKNYSEEQEKGKSVWVETKNTKFVRFIVNKTVKSGKIAIVWGEAGSGKTETLKRIASELGNALFIEIDAATTTRSLFYKITTALKVQGKRSLSDTLDVIVKALENRDVVLFFDECEYLNHKSIELLRRINDFTNTPIILSGTYDFMEKLKAHRQLASRIRFGWEMRKPTKEEIALYCAGFGIRSERVANLIYEKARANFRDIEAIVADSLEIDTDGVVDVSDVKSALEIAFIY